MLPELPKKIKRREAAVDGKVAAWLQKHHPRKNWLLEVKMKGGKHLQHQKTASEQVKKGTFLWKPPDFGHRNPGDYIRLGDADYIYCVVDGKDVFCTVNDEYKFHFKI